MVRIGDQWKRERIFRLEFLVAGDGIFADSDDLCVFRFETVDGVAKLRAFARSTRCVVFGIEPQDERLAQQLARVELPALVVNDVEFRHLGAFSKHG